MSSRATRSFRLERVRVSSRGTDRSRKARPFAPRAEALERRIALAGNIVITGVSVVDANDKPINPVYGGDLVYIRADFTTQGLPGGASYYVSYVVDGIKLESTKITYGAGAIGKPSFNEFWGTFKTKGGPNQVVVTINPDHSVAESNYADDVMNYTFQAVDVPAKLIFTSQNLQPPVSVTAGAFFGLTVSVEDAYGNLEARDNGSVSVNLDGNPGNSMLGGVTTVFAVNGVATFTGLTLNKTGAGYTLDLSRFGLSGTTSNLFTVVPAQAAQLVILREPVGSISAGKDFGPFGVAIEDFYGNKETGDNSTLVTASLQTGVGPLVGQLTATASNGMASFGNLVDDLAETIAITMSSGALAPATTTNVLVNPGAPSKLIVLTQPSTTATVGQPFAVQPVIEEEDQYGNLETGDNSSVVTASPSGGVGPLQGSSAVVSGGIATFATLLDKKAETLSVKFTSGNQVAATSSPIAVARATPTISWTPAVLANGTPLGSSQLDAVALSGSASLPGTFTYSLTSGTVLALGSYPISLTFTPNDSADYTTTTATSTILVLPATLTTLNVSAGMIVLKQPITLTASVLPSSGGATPTGSITFFDGSTFLGIAPLDAKGSATLTTINALPGSTPITARYSGDSANAPSLSPSTTLIVREPAAGDFDGDGKSDITVFQPSTSTFFIIPSSHPGQPYAIQFGQGTNSGGNPVPVSGDFDGDGKADIAIFQPSTSTFFIMTSSHPTHPYSVQFGQGTNSGGNPVPVPGDYEGIGMTEIAVYQASTSTFFVIPSSNPSQPYATQFGQGTNSGGHPLPIVGDFDGDGKTDIAVFQPTSSTFFVIPSSTPSQPYATQFGQGSAAGGSPLPIVGDFDGDGKTDIALFQPSTSTFFVIPSSHPSQPYAVQLGQGVATGGNPVPLVGDFDGDGQVDIALFQASTSTFFVKPSSHPAQPYATQFGQGTAAGGHPIPLLRPTS